MAPTRPVSQPRAAVRVWGHRPTTSPPDDPTNRTERPDGPDQTGQPTTSSRGGESARAARRASRRRYQQYREAGRPRLDRSGIHEQPPGCGRPDRPPHLPTTLTSVPRGRTAPTSPVSHPRAAVGVWGHRPTTSPPDDPTNRTERPDGPDQTGQPTTSSRGG